MLVWLCMSMYLCVCLFVCMYFLVSVYLHIMCGEENAFELFSVIFDTYYTSGVTNLILRFNPVIPVAA